MGRTLQRYRKLFETLKKGDPKSLYFLYGPEEYIKKEFVGELIKRALDKGNRAFNLDVFHGDEFQRDAFNDRVSSFPLFTDRRIIIIKKFDALTTAYKDFVLERLEGLPDSLVCVAETPVDKLDNARLKRLKALADARGVSFRFQYLAEDETVERLTARVRKEGHAIEPDAMDLLIGSVGTQLIDLTNELDKIILCAGDEKVITKDVVSQVVGRYRTENLFSLLDRLGTADVSQMVRRMNRVIDSGEEPVFVLAMLLRRVLQLLEVKALLQEKGPKARSAKVMSGLMVSYLSPYFASALVEQAARLDTGELENLLQNLRWADFKLKSTAIPARSILETALIASSARKKLALYAN